MHLSNIQLELVEEETFTRRYEAISPIKFYSSPHSLNLSVGSPFKDEQKMGEKFSHPLKAFHHVYKIFLTFRKYFYTKTLTGK